MTVNTVLYIGNFGPEHSTENHVAQACRELGLDVVCVQENGVALPHRPDVATVPWEAVAHATLSLDAPIVLWTHTHDYAAGADEDRCWAMIDACHDIGVRTVSFHLDRWWGLEREHQVTEPFFHTDLVCTADGGHDAEWRANGTNHVWMPPAVAASEAQLGTARSRHAKDVGFVGSWQQYGHAEVWPWRFEVVNAARLRYGSRFRCWPRGGEAVRGRELADVYASVKVLLGDSCLAPARDGSPMTRYWSDRIPETLGRGGFLLHPEVVGLRDWFECELPWTFPIGDTSLVHATIDRALGLSDAERRLLQRQAHEHVLDRHTYAHRMLDVIALAEGL